MNSKYIIGRRRQGSSVPEFWTGKMSISFDGWSVDSSEAEHISFGSAVVLVKSCNNDPWNKGFTYATSKVDLSERPQIVTPV